MNKLTQMLLASTCLTAVTTSPAAALSFTEVEPNNTLATANAAPLGTTEIVATAEQPSTSPFAFIDFFKLSGLQPGGSFSATVERQTAPPGGFFFNSQFIAADSGGTTVDSEPLAVSPNFLQTATVSGTIPLNGMLVLETTGGISEGGPMGYHITITAPLAAAVPEPSTLGLLASGLAGLAGFLGLRRQKRG
jgi:PEP-CTERM motif